MGAVSADLGLFEDAFDSNSGSVFASPCSSSCVGGGGGGYIEHRVSKMDTLAGIAIKYGVEVADIKRMNGLVTDIQMFAHKSLQIPLPGRHPPSTIHPNGSAIDRNTVTKDFSQENALAFQSLNFKSKEIPNISPAMSKLQGYYGLAPPAKASTAEGTEMTVYRTYNKGELVLDQFSPVSDPETPILHTQSKSLGFSNLQESGELYQSLLVKEVEDKIDTEKYKADNSVRRRQKADPVAPVHPETILKDDFPIVAKTNKGLPSLLKSGSRIKIRSARQYKSGMEESSMVNDYHAVKKSFSTTSLVEDEGGLSLWSTSVWNLKPDSGTKPLFEGLPKPVIPWRSKNARD